MDEYMKKYREQMDQATLSDAADQAILDDLLKANGRKGVPYMKWAKRNISAAMVAAVIAIASVVTVFAGVVGTIIRSNKAESQIEGLGAKVDVGNAYYLDLLAGDAGEIYVLTGDGQDGHNSALTGHPVVAWKSTDQGDTWQEALSQPDGLNENCFLVAGDLRKGENGIEAIVVIAETGSQLENGQVHRVYQITADSYVQYNIEEASARLGRSIDLFNVKYVNSHTIALVGSEKCLLYDTNTQQVVKELPYDMTMGCLKTQDQFLLYGKEIYSCINSETLEDQEAEEGLQEFMQLMYAKNSNLVLPPMYADNETIVCAAKAGIYEFRAGKTTEVRPLSDTVTDGHPFNGLLPICKAQDGSYYICAFSGDIGMALWQIDGDKEELK